MRKLEANDRMIDELLAKGAALVGVLDGVLVADAREPQALDNDADPLMVEVRHHHTEALVFLANEVLDGYLDVLKRHIRCTRRPHALAVHTPRANAASLPLDQQH